METTVTLRNFPPLGVTQAEDHISVKEGGGSKKSQICMMSFPNDLFYRGADKLPNLQFKKNC